jgi:hypothetical protein
MLSRNAVLFAFLVLLLAFVAGVATIYEFRTEQGDVFPPYSTFRADPLGTKALYESLARLKDLKVSRNYKADDKIGDPGGALLFLGVPAGPFFTSGKESIKRFTDQASRGNRVILSFQPIGTNQSVKDAGEAGKSLHFQVGFEPARNPKSRVLYFQNPGPDWKVLVTATGHPRVISRAFGSGALILCSDSYLFSNEAILKDRQTRLIAEIIGDVRNVVFDEAHHGMHDDGSLGTLARRYRLHGFAAGLLLLAGLYLWRSSARFLPPIEEEDRLDSVSGKDAASGLVKLLKRSVPPNQLASVCLAEWKKAPQLQEKCGKEKAARIEAVVREQKDPVESYRAIHRILAERN